MPNESPHQSQNPIGLGGFAPPTLHSIEQDMEEGLVRVDPDGELYRTTSWATVDLGPAKRGEKTTALPAFLPRDDGQMLIYPGKPHVFYGPSESLKTWAALLACKSVVEAGLKALYIDFEGDETAFVERARVAKIAETAIGGAFRYIRPVEALVGSATALADLMFEETDLGPSLVVLDGVTECYALHGWDINKATDAAEFQKVFGRFAEGTARIMIDHTGKDASRGQVGSQHKRAGLDGAEYQFTPILQEGRGGHSMASVKVTKDRHGYIREFAPRGGQIGMLHVGAQGVWLAAPKLSDLLGPGEALIEQLVGWVTANPGQSTRAVYKAVSGSNAGKKSALEGLEQTKVLRTEAGPRRARLWFPGTASY